MADAPQNFDDLVEDQDPQSAMAAQGLQQGLIQAGKAIESGPAIEKAPMEGVTPESDPITDLAGGYLGSKLGEGAGEILGNEIGSVGSDVKKMFKPSSGAFGNLGYSQIPDAQERAAEEALMKANPPRNVFAKSSAVEQAPASSLPTQEVQAPKPPTLQEQVIRKQVPWQEGPEMAPSNKIITPDQGNVAAFPVSIEGRKVNALNGNQYHATIKQFNSEIPNTDAVSEAAKSANAKIPDANKVTIEPTVFKDRNGNDVHVLKLSGEDSSHITNLNKALSSMGEKEPYEFAPHIAVDKGTWDKVVKSGAKTAADAGIKFNAPEILKGGYSVRLKGFAEGGQIESGHGIDPNMTWWADGGGVNFDDLQADPSPMSTQSQDFDSLQDDSETYGSGEQQAKAGLEGLGQGLIGPLAPALEEQLGVKPEDIRARAEANPGTHLAGEIAGFAIPAALTGGVSTELGSFGTLAKFTQQGVLDSLAEKAGLTAGNTLASKMGIQSAKAAIDSMLISGSDEASKLVLKDPDQSAQTALINIGLSGLLGAGVGAAFGGISPLWEAAQSTKAGQVVEDFKSRMNEHLNDPNPVQSVTRELQELHDSTANIATEVSGAEGLKAQNIAKVIPEMNEKISSQSQDILQKLTDAYEDDLATDPNRPLLADQINQYKQAVESEDPASIFSAQQDLKKQLQEWSKYDSKTPLSEVSFRKTIKGLGREVRLGLEDQSVWGDAAKITKDINRLYSGSTSEELESGALPKPGYITAQKDFQKKFMSNVGGELKVDPGKVETYLNQIGKPKAELKQEMVQNFIDSTQNFKNKVNDLFVGKGLESPIQPSPLTATMSSLQQKTLGSKLADAFIAKGLTDAGGKTVGAGVGGALGSLIGHPELGAIIGGHSLGPFFSSIMPSIAKSLLGGETSAKGFKVAADYAAQVAKGTKILNNAAEGVFKAGKEVLPSHLYPSQKELDKLDDKLKELQTNVEPLLKDNSPLQHYMPNHNQSLVQSKSNAMEILNSMRASTDKVSPLDSAPVPSAQQKSEYKNALLIAQQPMVVMDKIKDGTITASDIKLLQTMYPALYQSMNQKLMDQMTTALSNGEKVPYKVRIGLSMFMAQPLDSTMSPQSIIAAQPIPQSPPQQPQGGKSRGARPSAPALQKLPNIYQTSDQARESRQQLRK